MRKHAYFDEQMSFQDGRKNTPRLTHFVVPVTSMAHTLAAQFMATNGGPLIINGETVVNIYRREVRAAQTIQVSLAMATAHPVQGLRLKLVGGQLEINGEALPEAIIWLDTAPPKFEFQCIPNKGRRTAELRIWNCWRGSDGTVQAWIGNAGMIVVENPAGKVTIRASSGQREFDPSQLMVELTIGAVM